MTVDGVDAAVPAVANGHGEGEGVCREMVVWK